MNLILYLNQYQPNSLFFVEPLKNNLSNEAHFLKFIYSTSFFSLNSISFYVPIKETQIEKHFNKCKCFFDKEKYLDVIEKIAFIENNILNTLQNLKPNKTKKCQIYDQLMASYFKITDCSIDSLKNKNTILKISGVWETNEEFGLTFKFLKDSNHLP
jgi:hypothetical protein